MRANRQQLDRSRLGRLLVNRGYISESQLQQALEQQRYSGERLGEVVVAAGWVTERELNRTLKHQNRYRYAAAVAAMVVAPLQPITALAASVPGAPTATPPTASQQARENGMQALTDAEMTRVSGQRDPAFMAQAVALNTAEVPAHASDQVRAAVGEEGAEQARETVLDSLELIASGFVPVLNFLDSDLSVSGVHFADDNPLQSIGADGITFSLPERIEEVRMDNIRVQGSSRAASMGNITMTNIQFSEDSHLRIRAR